MKRIRGANYGICLPSSFPIAWTKIQTARSSTPKDSAFHCLFWRRDAHTRFPEIIESRLSAARCRRALGSQGGCLAAIELRGEDGRRQWSKTRNAYPLGLAHQNAAYRRRDRGGACFRKNRSPDGSSTDRSSAEFFYLHPHPTRSKWFSGPVYTRILLRPVLSACR